MATNVTEKDKTLQEVIDWCETSMRSIGYLEHVPSKLRKELRGATEGIRESLTVEGVYQPVIISVNAGEKHLANGVKAVNILKEMSA